MREIKFKVYHSKYGEGRVISMSFYEKTKEINGDTECYAYYPKMNESLLTSYNDIEIMQYTGLKDINGVEIYEGDIVKGWYMEKGIKHRFIGQIKFVTGCFVVDGVKQYRGQRQELNIIFQPIGNIYENPELLGSSQ